MESEGFAIYDSLMQLENEVSLPTEIVRAVKCSILI